MRINDSVKEEILSGKISGKCCKKAFLSGVILGAGSLPIEKGGFGLIIQSPNQELIKKCVSIIAELCGSEPDIVKKLKELPLGNRVVYEVRLGTEEAAPLLVDLGIVRPPYGINESVPQETAAKPCCKKSFLRGIFCAAGSLHLAGNCKTGNTGGYNLDIALTSEESARSLEELMSAIGIQPSIRAHKNNYSVYLKDSEKIGDLFIALGANSAVFALNNLIASRSIRNNANRRTNCEVANIDKTLSASAKQLQAIAVIEQKAGLHTLDDALRDTAELRKAHPDASLTELAAMLRYPTSKSGLNHRLRKLIEIANDIGGCHAQRKKDNET